MRSFVALDLPEEMLDAIDDVQRRLPVGRRMARETLHLTLAFLGERTGSELAELDLALQDLPVIGPVPLVLEGCDVLAEGEVLHMPVREDPGLFRLHRAIAGALRVSGLQTERRRFRPHVTIARLSRPVLAANADRIARFLAAEAVTRIGPMEARSVSLFRSVLGPGGARHDRLAAYPLSA